MVGVGGAAAEGLPHSDADVESEPDRLISSTAGTFMSLYGAEMARSCASAIASPLSSTAARRVLSPFTLFVTAAAATAEVRFTTRDAWVGTVVDAAATHGDDKDGEKEDEAAKEGTADDVDGRLVEVGSACR